MERRSFRQWGQVMVGATLALLALGIAWAMVSGAMSRSDSGLAWLALLLVVAYAVFVRPCVVMDAGGVTVRNIVRDVHAPWRAVTGAHSAWNFVLETTSGSHSAWAISGTASPGRDALLRRSAPPLSGRPGAKGHVDRVDADAVMDGLTPPATGASAAALAALVDRERTRAAESTPPGRERTPGVGVGEGPIPARTGEPGAPEEQVRVEIAWLPAGLLLVACAAVFLAAAF